MFMRLIVAIAVAGALLDSAPASAGAVINSFYDTGVDNNHAVLANGAAEQHYTIFSAPGSATYTTRVATTANGFPLPPWLGDDTSSAWIGPNTDSSLDGPAGTYDYRTTFTLAAGYNPQSVSLLGQWAMDDSAMSVIVNGMVTNVTGNGYSSWSSLKVTNGFVTGLNTIDFLVYNGSGPTGLRVEATVTADLPEPGSLVVLASALVGAGLLRRGQIRRR